jgi:hypothetical protein
MKIYYPKIFNDDVIEQDLLDNENHMDIGCLPSVEGSCDLSNFDLILKRQLCLCTKSHYCSILMVTMQLENHRKVEETLVVAFFKAVVETKGGQLRNC